LSSTAEIPKSNAISLLSSNPLETIPRPPMRPPLPSSFTTSVTSQSLPSTNGIVLSARRISSSSSSSSLSSPSVSSASLMTKPISTNETDLLSSRNSHPRPPVLPLSKSKPKLSSTLLPSDFGSTNGAFETAMAGGDQLASFLRILEMSSSSNTSVNGGGISLSISSSSNNNGDDTAGLALAAACESIGDTMGIQTRNTWQPLLLHIHSKRLSRRNVPVMNLSHHLANINVKRGSSQYTALHYACLSLARLASHFILTILENEKSGNTINEKTIILSGTEETSQIVTPFALRQASGLVTLLVAAGADVNARILDTSGGQTPLHFLCSVSYPSLLLTNLSEKVTSALYFAEECLCRAADAMIYSGVDPNVVDTEYLQTPLHLSCRNGHPKLSSLLVSHGAKIDLQDRFLDSPLEAAEENLRVINAITMEKKRLERRDVFKRDKKEERGEEGVGGIEKEEGTGPVQSKRVTLFDTLVIRSSPIAGSPHLIMHIVSYLYENDAKKDIADVQSLSLMDSHKALQSALIEGPARRALLIEGTLVKDDTESSAWSMAKMLLIPPSRKGGLVGNSGSGSSINGSNGNGVEVALKRPPLVSKKRSGSVGSK
jgi:ankyrin repeat protein